MSEKRLIVGLGNPGKDYQYTRHNLGFLVAEKIAEVLGFKLSLSSFSNGITAEGKRGDNDVCLLMPLTYMNNSGQAVKQVCQIKDIKSQNVLVVCDDFNLSFQQMRIRPKGSDGGHNGLSSIITLLGTDQFNRLRMGVGLPKSGEVIDYVLEEFKRSEKKQLDGYIDEAVSCSLTWLDDGVEKAMEQFNRKQ